MKAIERLYKYLEYIYVKPTVFEKEIGFSSGYLSNQKKRNADLGESVLNKINDYCQDLNITWLLTGKGDMLKSEKLDKTKMKIKTGLIEPVTLFENNTKLVEIPIVDISAAAGYGAINSDHAEQLGVMKLLASMINKGMYYCIRNRGFSMSPTLQESDYIIVRYMQQSEWADMRDEHVYVVVDRDGHTYVKRVKNRLQKGFIVLTSDSIDKASYPNFNLQADEIANMFYAEWHFSAKMQNINETYYNRLKSLEDTVDILKEEFTKLKK